MATRARLIAIVGAECTGKSQLVQALAARLGPALQGRPDARVATVGEWLREWCDSTGRTPRVHEQGAILRAQHERIAAACAGHDWVIADTTALQTAVYSAVIFGDTSLRERALTLHARADHTLLTALDLPWQADGHQRDGAHMQRPVDTLLRQWLAAARLPFSVVHGVGAARSDQALAALAPLLARPAGGLPPGRFTGLAEGRAPGTAQRWWCECCDPEAEAALRRRAAGHVNSDIDPRAPVT
jgi:nicotinamide riboside kinase